MEENRTPETEQHLFDNYEYQLIQASSGKRFLNYIIDVLSFSVFSYLLSYVLVAISYDLAVLIYGDGETFNLVGQLIILLLYGMYMGLIESIFKGRSLGKLITGTVAVNEDGTHISGHTALLRGLCRAVPFNAFSALGNPSYPWHDKWTKSYVVDIKSLNRE
ncbi:MAG TPA: RDD family protein [Chitinophagaceae bacterium]